MTTLPPSARSPRPPAPPPRATSPASGGVMRALLHPAVKPVVFTLCLLPFAWFAYAALTDHLGANPQEALVRGLGDWTLRFLCLTLTITPLRKLTGWHTLLRLRRMLGLFSAFYVSMHFLAYAGFDKGFVLADILKDIGKRPFILVGSAAALLMLPLAATSFNRAVKALGGKRWQLLHRAVYAIVLLGLLHFFWMRAGKHDFAQVSIYAVVIAALLGWRLWDAFRPKIRVKTWIQPKGAGLIVRR
jgi:sulfoxide reductase heme-binding subunit YedZ